MEVTTLLSDTFVCRLCAEENQNATDLFTAEGDDQDLSQLVNRYLPIKVESDARLPSKICPGCNIQLQATKSFFDLIIDGQGKLRELRRVQYETLRRQQKQRQQLEEALKNVNPSSSVNTYAIHTDETGEKFLIQIISDGPLFPPDHELSLRAEGLDKPRRKRGRPPKPPPNEAEESKLTEIQDIKKDQEEEDDGEVDSEGRRKRKIKVPTRFLEAVQGKELDRMLVEEGVIDDGSDSEAKDSDAKENSSFEEVIGHMQSKDGENLGELIVVNKSGNKSKSKGKLIATGVKRRRKFECEICGRAFLHHGRYEVHKSFHKNVKYQCGEETCLLKADSKHEIEQHQKESGHSVITVVESMDNYGEVQLLKLEDVKEEKKNEAITKQTSPKKEQIFLCEICDKRFSCKQNYEVHHKAVHENHRPYECEQCHKTFPYLNSLKCHMVMHTDKNVKIYNCDVCSKGFSHPSSLVYHKEAEHNNGRRFICNKCNKSFKHKQLLQRHQLVHSEERPHVCSLCKATFKTRANLVNHMPIHTGEKKFSCAQCPQSFAHKTSLNLHMRWHNGQKPYQCDVCLKSFSQKGNLAEHKRIHTGEKPYTCEHCGRKFTTSSQFKLHVKRHTGERPWRCEYCPKTFLHKDTWKCHTRRHRDERPFKCGMCNREFTEQWALRKHERLHTGEKPYACSICGKGFADCSNLTKHKRVHFFNKNTKYSVQLPSDVKVLPVGNSDQVLYLSYQNSPVEETNQTLMPIMNTLDPLATDLQTNNLQNSLDIPDELQKVSDDIDNSIHLQQVIDHEGNPVNLTTADGHQIKVVTSVENGQQNFQGLLPDGTLIPIDLSLQDVKSEMEGVLSDLDLKDDKEGINKMAVNEDNNDPEYVSSVGQMLDPNPQFLAKFDNNIQFLTEDGQNVCFIAACNEDDAINQQFLTMA